MELIENLLQLLTTFVGALLSGIAYRKSHRQAYFLLLCFYGCFALGALYWTLYLLLFDTTPRVFYVSEFGWVASLIFLRILQATLTSQDERSFRSRSLIVPYVSFLLKKNAKKILAPEVRCFAAPQGRMLLGLSRECGYERVPLPGRGDSDFGTGSFCVRT